MNLNLIKNKSNLHDLLLKDDKILEIRSSEKDGDDVLGFYLYDPASNKLKEIAPDIRKYRFITVNNCIWHSGSIYFASYKESAGDPETVFVDVYTYSAKTDFSKLILSVPMPASVVSGEEQVRLFILSELYVLVQREKKREAPGTTELSGGLEFCISLYNRETGNCVEVTDEVFTNGGINCIVPVTETHIMLKTGFSFFEDERLLEGSKDDAMVESVYYGPISQLISTLTKSGSLSFDLIWSSFHDRCILSPGVEGEYIYFTVLDPASRRSESMFYHYPSGSIVKCQNMNVDLDDPYIAYVVNNVPYIRHNMPGVTEFINLQTSEIDCTFYDEDFVAVLGRFFIFKKMRRLRTVLRIYRFPKLDLVLEEHGIYRGGIINGNDYYIYL